MMLKGSGGGGKFMCRIRERERERANFNDFLNLGDSHMRVYFTNPAKLS